MNQIKLMLGIGLIGLLISGGPAAAMDRWSALSLIESDDNDAAIGQAGEVSRFQIKPGLWRDFYALPPAGERINPVAAWRVAQAIMTKRCAAFVRRFHRQPTNFEFYVLWNAPAQIERPGHAVAERAARFCNLTDSPP